jgi:hypothetical protein
MSEINETRSESGTTISNAPTNTSSQLVIGSSRPQPTQEELTDFKGKLSEWTKLDEQLVKLNIAVKERKTHKKALEEGIQTFMTKYGYTDITIASGKIKHTVRTVKQPIKLTEIIKLLEASKDLRCEDLLKQIKERERPSTEKHTIRRYTPPITMNLDS